MRYLRRYSDSERIVHWAVALLFILASLSGLALFHPTLFFFSNAVGGASLARIFHPFIGVLMTLLFVYLFFRMWHHNHWTPTDTKWIANAGSLMKGDKSGMPPVGRYNAGQKAVFWLMTLTLIGLLVTGIVFWRPYFADAFPIPLRRLAVLLHAIAALALVLGIITHIYAAIWVKGTTRAMTRGTVTENWAKLNHPIWHREMLDGQRPPPAARYSAHDR